MRRVVAFAFACALGVAFPACAQQVLFTVRPGLDGNVRRSHFWPISVDLKNTGESTQGVLCAALKGHEGSVVCRRVELPAGATKRVFLYMFPRWEYVDDVVVAFRPDRGRPTSHTARVRNFLRGDALIALVCEERIRPRFFYAMGKRFIPPRPEARNFAAAVEWKTAVAVVPAELAPERWEGYDGADVVVLGPRAAQKLTTAQAQAIARWVARGETLVVWGGERWRELADSPLAGLLPIAPRGCQVLGDAGKLAAWAGATPEPAGPVAVTTGELAAGEVCLRQDGVPLIARRTLGMGRVWFFAFSPLAEPLRSWPGMADVFARVLAEARWRAHGYVRTINELGLVRSAFAEGRKHHPSMLFVGLFLALYAVCLVPVNYLVLHALRRRELAWLTTIVIVAVFTAVAYAIGVRERGLATTVRTACAVEMRSGSRYGRVRSYTQIFSGRRAEYNVRFDGEGAAIFLPLQAGAVGTYPVPQDAELRVFQEGEENVAREFGVGMWSERWLGAEAVLRFDGPLEARLVRVGGCLRGTIDNRTGLQLEDAVLCYRGTAEFVGTIVPGIKKDVLMKLDEALEKRWFSTSFAGAPPADEEQYRRILLELEQRGPECESALQAKIDSTPRPSSGDSRRAVLRAVVENNGGAFCNADEAMLVAWAVNNPLPPEVDGEKVRGGHETLVLVHIPISK